MKDTYTLTVNSGTIIKILAWLTIFTGLLYISDFVIALLVAVVLATALEMPVAFLVKRRVPRSLAVSLLFLFVVLFFAMIAIIFIPPLADDIALFIKTLPQILDSVRIFGKDMGFKDLALAVQDLSRDISKGQILTILKNGLFGTGGFFATTSVLLSGIINLTLTFVMAFYLALEEHGVHKFLRTIVPKKQELYVEDLWMRAQHKIGMWMQGQLLLSLLVSLLIYIPLLILHIPYAALLALLVFLGELIPMVGLTLATIPALFLAFSKGGVQLMGIVFLVYFVIGQLESNVLYPKVMNKMVGVPSIVILIALVIGAKFAGIWGMVLAVPLAAIMMEVISDVEKRKQEHEQ